MEKISLLDIITCPCKYKNKISQQNKVFKCEKIGCVHNLPENAFRVVETSLVLISEKTCDTVCVESQVASYVSRPPESKWRNFLKSFLGGISDITINNCSLFVKLLNEISKSPNVLVIGSGTKGSGTDELYASNNITLFGIDIYASKTVDIVADAHYLPFKDQVFDGVWIQAVLEHVVDPKCVVDEIYRVLKSDGVVYAETPFMQQVHEGRYDFTRFTVLGHRYLFKKFSEIRIGGNKGVGVALAWSIRYFVWAIFRNRKLAQVVGISVNLPLRIIEKMADKRSLYDSSSGVFFLGRKSEAVISHKELIRSYKGLQ